MIDRRLFLQGSLTGSVHRGETDDPGVTAEVLETLSRIAGRVIVDGYPTGVEVCDAMMHGGPYPATTAASNSSVGTLAMLRFARPVAYQNLPDALLPADLRDANPRGIWRRVDGACSRDPIGS